MADWEGWEVRNVTRVWVRVLFTVRVTAGLVTVSTPSTLAVTASVAEVPLSVQVGFAFAFAVPTAVVGM